MIRRSPGLREYVIAALIVAALMLLAFVCVARAQIGPLPGTGPLPQFANAPPTVTFQAITHNTSTQTTYTFTSAAIGTAGARNVIVYVGGSNNGLNAPSSITVGGVTCNLVSDNASHNAAVIGASNATSALYICPSSVTGTTANIVVTWSGNQVRTTIAVWAAYNLTSLTAVVQPATSTSATANLNMNMTPNQLLIVGGESGTATTATATGYTQRFDETDSAGELYAGGDFISSITESPRTITITFNGSTVYASVAAVFH